MIKRIALGDGTTLVMENRATGLVRIGFEHEHHTVTRADVSPELGVSIARELRDVACLVPAAKLFGGRLVLVECDTCKELKGVQR